MLVLFLLLYYPFHAIAADLPADGQYTASVALSGGSGRAAVNSPAAIRISGNTAEATVIWSSPYYEYMRIDGVTYYPLLTEGNAAFEIPIVFDREIAVTAQTIAMSEPHQIDYTLYFDSATIKPLSGGPGKPVIVAMAAVLLLILLGGYLWKRAAKRKQRKAG